jgi:hypothetical protein
MEPGTAQRVLRHYAWHADPCCAPQEAPCSGSFGGACCLYLLALYCGFPCLVSMGTRSAVRRKYNLKVAPSLRACARPPAWPSVMHAPGCLPAASQCRPVHGPGAWLPAQWLVA